MLGISLDTARRVGGLVLFRTPISLAQCVSALSKYKRFNH